MVAFLSRSLLMVLIAGAIGCARVPTAVSADGITEQPLPPEGARRDRPFFNGAFLGDASSTPERIAGAMRDFGTLTGKPPALVKTYHDLDADLSASGWAGTMVRAVTAAGGTNFLALDLSWRDAPSGRLLQAINGGRADDQLARAAQSLADTEQIVLVELAWEMNGDWSYGWQGIRNGANVDAPRDYVAAWRRVVDIFRAAGAHNVRWVFGPNTGNPVAGGGQGAAHWNWYGHYYPGDAYVDYVGVHGFNGPSVWGGPWRDFGTLFDSDEMDRVLSDMVRRFPNKPLIVGEVASEEGTGGGKGRWIEEAYAALRRYPNVVGAVWFHMDKEADWRVNSSRSALEGFRRALADPAVLSAFHDVSTARGAVWAAADD